MKALFISYNGALEPLIKSQGIPYLEGLSKKGVGCVLLTFEKIPAGGRGIAGEINVLRAELRAKDIEWYPLRYHKKPTLPATIFDLLQGIAVALYIIISRKIDIIHCRAAVAGVIGFVAAGITGKKILLDERGLMAEEYADGGMWKRDGMLYRAVRKIEKMMLRKAAAVVVLTENIRDFLLTSDYLFPLTHQQKREISVIPCCVDLKRFNINGPVDDSFRRERGMEGKFVFVYSGSLGTWYLLREMVEFFKCAKTAISNAHFLFLSNSESSAITGLWKANGLSFSDLTIKNVAYESVSGLIRCADCGVFFIKPVLSKRSSCPIKFAEYLSCGLPVVLNPGIGDTDKIVKIDKVGVVCEGFSRQDYLSCARSLQALIKEGDLLRDRCYNSARSLFRLELGVDSYYEVYKKIKEMR